MHRFAGRTVSAFLLAALVTALTAASDSAEPSESASARASALSAAGRFDEAVLVWREAAVASEAAGATGERVAALVKLADAQQTLGRYEDAKQTLAEALGAAGANAEAAQLAAIHASLGNVQLALGPPAEARAHLEQALTLARQLGDETLAAAVLTNLGNLGASREEYADALRAYSESAVLAEQAGERGLAARAYANAARAALARGAPAPEVRRALERSASLAAELPPSHDLSYLLVSTGSSYARLSALGAGADAADLGHAHAQLLHAEQIAESIGDARALSYALGQLGALYEQQGRLDEALVLSRRALFQAQQANAPESIYRWHWQIGRILRAKGKSVEAIAAYQQSVAVLQSIRFSMAHGYASGEGSFRDAVGPVFFELVDLLLATAPDPQEVAAHQARLLEARETVEQLKTAELRDYFRDECVEALEAKTESLDQVSPSAAVIYPVVLADRLELLLTSSTGIRRATLPVRGAALTTEVGQLRALLEKRTTRQFLPHAQQLYDWLVRPLEADLAQLGVDTLVFVPDGPLRTIPMSALHDGERFVIERWAVATTPGLSLTDPRPLERANLQAFLGGLSEPVQGFPALDHVRAELASIGKLFAGETLLDGDFRQPRVEHDLGARDFSLVHIATHAEFSEDAESSFLLTFDGRITMDRLGETVGSTRFRERPIELLTLSACETAQGNERAALGLAGVAIQAGARSALGTLWSVNDFAAAELVSDFYGELRKDSVSKALALRRAQEKLIADPSYGHPFYWSPFLLISNWL